MISPYKQTITPKPNPISPSPVEEKKEMLEEIIEAITGVELDSTKIASFFSQMITKVHFCHHNTTSFSTHKAMDKLYDKLTTLKDKVLEQAIGYTGKRYDRVDLSTIAGFSEEMCTQVAYETMEFARDLEKWADDNYYCNLSNLAQEMSGAGAQALYLLTLK